MRTITVKVLDGIPRPFFGESIEDSVLSCYLEDAELNFEDYLQEIQKAEKGESIPTGLTGNQMDVSFYPGKAIIEALWFNDDGVNDSENFASVEIPLSEAKELLLEWKEKLKEWEASKSDNKI